MSDVTQEPARFPMALRGYSTADVDRHIALLTRQISELEEERAALRAQLEGSGRAASARDAASSYDERLAALDAVITAVAVELTHRDTVHAADTEEPVPATSEPAAVVVGEPEEARAGAVDEPEARDDERHGVDDQRAGLEPEPEARPRELDLDFEEDELEDAEAEAVHDSAVEAVHDRAVVDAELPPVAGVAEPESREPDLEIAWGPERARIPVSDTGQAAIPTDADELELVELEDDEEVDLDALDLGALFEDFDAEDVEPAEPSEEDALEGNVFAGEDDPDARPRAGDEERLPAVPSEEDATGTTIATPVPHEASWATEADEDLQPTRAEPADELELDDLDLEELDLDELDLRELEDDDSS